MSVSRTKTAVIKSLQRGTISFTNGGSDSPTATITAVDGGRSSLKHLGATTNGATNIGIRLIMATSQNVTTVQATRDSAFNSFAVTVGFEVLEYV